MSGKKQQKAAAPAFVSDQVVRVTGGTYAGQAGRIRGELSETGTYAVLIAGKVRKIKADNLGVHDGHA